MSPPPQLSRSATGGLIGSISDENPSLGLPKTAPVSSKGGRREIPYLAGVAKFQARGPLFRPDMAVCGRPRGPHTTSPVPDAPKQPFWRFRPGLASRDRPFCPHSGFRIAGVGQITCPAERQSRARKRKQDRAGLEPRAEEHDVQRARGQQHEHQRDLQAVAGEFENRPHLRMMERVRARVSGDIFAFGGEGFRTRLRVDSLKPQREKAPEGAAHDPPKCERFGAKIMRPSNSLRARSFVDRALKSHIPHQGKLVRNSSACVLSALR